MKIRITLKQRSVRLLAVALVLSVASPSTFAGALEEIVVTSTKREESLQDVPISIGVVTGEMVEKFDIKDLTDLQGYIPSLSVQSTFGNWSVRIRGLGSGVTNLAFDSSVSIFSDGVYCGRSQCLESALLDLDRVEVARGPQGALFGKSTIAGAISLISARPTDEFEAYIKAGAEFEDGGYDASGMISGPIDNNIRGRLAVKYTDRDGYVKNTFLNRDETEWDSTAFRGSLEWDPTEHLSFYWKIEGSDKNEDGNSNQLVSPGLFGSRTMDPNSEYVANDIRHVGTGTAVGEFEDNDALQSALVMDADLCEHTLTAIVGWADMEMERYLDVDGVPENFLNTFLATDYEAYSGEIRLLSPGGETFDYIIGAMYQSTDLTTRQHSSFGFFPAFLAPVPVGSDRNFERDADTYSIYGQLTWNATDRLSVIADVRYTEEDQDGFAFSFPTRYPDLYNPVYDATAFNQPPEFYFRQNRNDDSVDPSIRVNWAMNDNVNAYIAYATGSKPGGLKANDGQLGALLLAKPGDLGAAAAQAYYERYVGQSTVTPADLLNGLTLAQGNGVMDFEDEEAENIEIGAKMTLANGAATLNIALFQMDFDNLQTSSYDGQRFIIGNAASAEITGAEVEGSWQITDSFSLSGSLAWLDTEYKDYPGAQCLVADASGVFQDPNCQDGQENLAGRPLQRTPELEVNLSANWNTQLTDTLELRTGFAFYHSDEYHVQEDEHPLGVQDSYQKYDLRLGLASSKDDWELAFVGRNLGDENVIQHAYEIAGSYFNAFSQGRTLSIEATKRW